MKNGNLCLLPTFKKIETIFDFFLIRKTAVQGKYLYKPYYHKMNIRISIWGTGRPSTGPSVRSLRFFIKSWQSARNTLLRTFRTIALTGGLVYWYFKEKAFLNIFYNFVGFEHGSPPPKGQCPVKCRDVHPSIHWSVYPSDCLIWTGGLGKKYKLPSPTHDQVPLGPLFILN